MVSETVAVVLVLRRVMLTVDFDGLLANKMNKKRNKKGGASWTTYMLTYMPFLSPILAMSGHTGGGSSLNQSSVGGATSIGTQSQPKGSSNHETARTDAANGKLVAPAGHNSVAPEPTHAVSLRAAAPLIAQDSAAPARRTSVRWSGKLMSETESQKVFKALVSAQVEVLAEELPAKFEAVADHELSGPDAISDDDDDVGAAAELRGVEMV